jgi:PBP1b-binding outer membrane lipoprotein LpoB
MKQLKSIFLVVLLSTILTGCSTQVMETEPATEVSDQQVSIAPQAQTLVESVKTRFYVRPLTDTTVVVEVQVLNQNYAEVEVEVDSIIVPTVKDENGQVIERLQVQSGYSLDRDVVSVPSGEYVTVNQFDYEKLSDADFTIEADISYEVSNEYVEADQLMIATL